MPQSYLEKARQVLRLESAAITTLIDRIDDRFQQAVEAIAHLRGKLIVTGVGKSGLVGRKIAATLSSTGTPSFFMHAGDAGHGDLGAITADDIMLLISNSGETIELLNLIPTLKRLGILTIGMIGKPQSSVAQKCDILLHVGVESEACPMGIIPTASTIVAMAMGDALAIALVDKSGFKAQDFAGLHPGGALGKRLLTTVADLMHSGAEVPFIGQHQNMQEVLFEMTRKGLGIVGVLDEKDRLVGVISDGDIRRGLEKSDHFLQLQACEIMSRKPKYIDQTQLAIDALHLMETHAITSLFVYHNGHTRRPVGIIHIHDILRYGIMS